MWSEAENGSEKSTLGTKRTGHQVTRPQHETLMDDTVKPTRVKEICDTLRELASIAYVEKRFIRYGNLIDAISLLEDAYVNKQPEKEHAA